MKRIDDPEVAGKLSKLRQRAAPIAPRLMGVGIPVSLQIAIMGTNMLGGLQILALGWIVIRWSLARRWRRLALLALAAVLLAFTYGAIALYLNARGMAADERYDWRQWWLIGSSGLATCAVGCFIGLVVERLVRAVRGRAHRARGGGTASR